MSFVIGVDAECGLDLTGYWIKPGSYSVKQPRTRKATVREDGSEGYVSLGPGKREWSMVILCINDLFNYQGVSTNFTGQQYRDALRASYATIGEPVQFTDPQNVAIPVHFQSYSETILDVKSQQAALATGGSAAATYEVAIVLVEV
jgi:hypothetical protein